MGERAFVEIQVSTKEVPAHCWSQKNASLDALERTVSENKNKNKKTVKTGGGDCYFKYRDSKKKFFFFFFFLAKQNFEEYEKSRKHNTTKGSQ